MVQVELLSLWVNQSPQRSHSVPRFPLWAGPPETQSIVAMAKTVLIRKSASGTLFSAAMHYVSFFVAMVPSSAILSNCGRLLHDPIPLLLPPPFIHWRVKPS